MAVKNTGVRKRKSPVKKTSGKTANKGNPKRAFATVLFLVFIFIVFIAVFFAFLPNVSKNITLPFKQTRQSDKSVQTIPETVPVQKPAQPAASPAAPVVPAEKQPESTVQKPAPERGTETRPVQPDTQQPLVQKPESTPAANTSPPAEKPPIPEKTPETYDRSIYFLRDSGAGTDLILVRVNRKIRVSESPLFDSINALLSGPTVDEKRLNLTSFIPSDSRINSAMIRGNTAYLDFNEDFRYNTLGREGCEIQLKQIVWTATEFPNVHDVQFLIEGRRVDFLSEGVMIGSPIGR